MVPLGHQGIVRARAGKNGRRRGDGRFIMHVSHQTVTHQHISGQISSLFPLHFMIEGIELGTLCIQTRTELKLASSDFMYPASLRFLLALILCRAGCWSAGALVVLLLPAWVCLLRCGIHPTCLHLVLRF